MCCDGSALDFYLASYLVTLLSTLLGWLLWFCCRSMVVTCWIILGIIKIQENNLSSLQNKFKQSTQRLGDLVVSKVFHTVGQISFMGSAQGRK